MAIKMRISKDRKIACNACGNDLSKSVEMFDVCLGQSGQNKLILHICDKCMGELMDKSLKARCKVDAMVKTPKQMHIINGRKRAEILKREKERNGEK